MYGPHYWLLGLKLLVYDAYGLELSMQNIHGVWADNMGPKLTNFYGLTFVDLCKVMNFLDSVYFLR